ILLGQRPKLLFDELRERERLGLGFEDRLSADHPHSRNRLVSLCLCLVGCLLSFVVGMPGSLAASHSIYGEAPIPRPASLPSSLGPFAIKHCHSFLQSLGLRSRACGIVYRTHDTPQSASEQ